MMNVIYCNMVRHEKQQQLQQYRSKFRRRVVLLHDVCVVVVLLMFSKIGTCTPKVSSSSSSSSLSQSKSQMRSSIDRNTGVNIHGNTAEQRYSNRELLQQEVYYRTDSAKELGAPNVNAGLGNPMKGLSRFGSRNPLAISPNATPGAIEFYTMGLDEIMLAQNTFNWTMFDFLVQKSASQNMHSVFSIFIHWPGEPLRLPPHIVNMVIENKVQLYDTSNGKSPNYGDPNILQALQEFIFAWGQHCDGDTRIAALHVGLLGFWGEGHTFPEIELVPDIASQSVAKWYRQAFTKTHIQARYPGPNAVEFGLFDASLAYSTLDGEENGGVDVEWFMYPEMIKYNQTKSYQTHIIGGEIRPELQSYIFTDRYPNGTENHQDIHKCVDTLHVSYAIHHHAYENGGYSGDTLTRANDVHAKMGYAYYINEISAMSPSSVPTDNTNDNNNVTYVDVSVVLTQLGIAPYYYDLQLQLTCNSGKIRMVLPGVEKIIVQGATKEFVFTKIPATAECLYDVELSLQSSYAYPNRPIKFAQTKSGADVGSKFTIRIPLPGEVVRGTGFLSLFRNMMRQFFAVVVDFLIFWR